ncbi:hypothetical protein BB561_006059 [Smittium simulii]|uniref:Reverse transcriptase zinc-binding domain-containing protein n=1 Tax=Smittium simulii TaxID=133385 RepID=A0A2T9Y6U9_9FUNG|nr:hypothetical protein BB561_006059 [Smittium simulii]
MPDVNNECNYCSKIENTKHIFFICIIIEEFGKLVSNFFAKTLNPNNSYLATITVSDIINGISKLKSKIPNIEILHALALWEIHQCITDSRINQRKISAVEIFAHCIESVKRKVRLEIQTKGSESKWLTPDSQLVKLLTNREGQTSTVPY